MISIIVPIYKVEEYLPRCIESILNQTYQDFELILVDDGSPDLSGDICDAYAENDPRIKVIHQDNSGISDARNIGLSRARGEYISFIDSDDWVHPEFLQQLLYTIEKYDADIAECGKILTPEHIEPEKLSINEGDEADEMNGADANDQSAASSVWSDDGEPAAASVSSGGGEPAAASISYDAGEPAAARQSGDTEDPAAMSGSVRLGLRKKSLTKKRFKGIHLRRKSAAKNKKKGKPIGGRSSKKTWIKKKDAASTSRFQSVKKYLKNYKPKRWRRAQQLSPSWFTVYDAQEALKLMIDDKNFYKHVWNKLYRRSVIEGLEFPAGKLHEDEFWTYQALGRARRIARVNAPMYYYFQRDVSVLGGRFSYEKLDLIEGKWERQKYIDEHYPALSGFARTNLYASMINAGQAILKDLKGNEKKMAVKKIDSYRSKPGISSGMSKESASYQGIWFFLSRISFWGTCRIRNILKIG